MRDKISENTLRRRPREWFAGSIFETVARFGALRPSMMPENLRRQLRILGVSDNQLLRSLLRMHTLADWPYVWEAEGDTCMADRDYAAAFASYYAGQRILITTGPYKKRLYELAKDAYQKMSQPQIEVFDAVNDKGEKVAGYLQLPTNRKAPYPCVLMLPGVTGTKEELHSYAMPLLKRGYAVARIDHPVYGDTEGLLDHVSVSNARCTYSKLLEHTSIDSDRIHVHGMSMGAHFALHTVLGVPAASITVICPPFNAGAYTAGLPTSNLMALEQMTGIKSVDGLAQFAAELSLVNKAHEIVMPLGVFHGGRDRTIPLSDAEALVKSVSGPSVMTVYERDHHNCLEHIGQITAATLEFIDNPLAVCERVPKLEQINEPATLHVSDKDAAYAQAGRAGKASTGAFPLIVRGRKIENEAAKIMRSILRT